MLTGPQGGFLVPVRARPPAEAPRPALGAYPASLAPRRASRTWMWQEISESSGSRMVHFISWLSDLMLELRKWIIFMVLLPLRTQWQDANMHGSRGSKREALGDAALARADTHTR